MMISNRRLKEITINNLRNGEVSINELDEIYKKMGFLFVINQGRCTRVRKERN
ncbi:hypothetical protein [Paraclostridium sordellii]|uniref:hypothetical protein n=1 Tax=Paraclostridium sordellii TaxID=1505 RepID=UPI0015F43063|nr:hypothetical protein [Paeniclostridium sordellii]